MRIRTIKPEFWRSPDITSLSSYFVRLFFIGLWTYVDDNGVGDDDVDLIRSDLFPRDNVEEVGQLIHGALSECSHKGLIVRYEDSVSGRRYLQVVNWHHQRINRPSKSSKPLPSSGNNPVSEGSVSTHGAVREPSLNTHGALSEGSLQEGIKGTREQGRGGAAAAPPPTPQETANSEQETIGPYGPRCPDHRDDPDPPSCPGCKRARLAVEARERDTAERAHAEREQIRKHMRTGAGQGDETGVVTSANSAWPRELAQCSCHTRSFNPDDHRAGCRYPATQRTNPENQPW